MLNILVRLYGAWIVLLVYDPETLVLARIDGSLTDVGDSMRVFRSSNKMIEF